MIATFIVMMNPLNHILIAYWYTQFLFSSVWSINYLCLMLAYLKHYVLIPSCYNSGVCITFTTECRHLYLPSFFVASFSFARWNRSTFIARFQFWGVLWKMKAETETRANKKGHTRNVSQNCIQVYVCTHMLIIFSVGFYFSAQHEWFLLSCVCTHL